MTFLHLHLPGVYTPPLEYLLHRFLLCRLLCDVFAFITFEILLQRFLLHGDFLLARRVSLVVELGAHSRRNLGCSHWLEFVYTIILSWHHFACASNWVKDTTSFFALVVTSCHPATIFVAFTKVPNRKHLFCSQYLVSPPPARKNKLLAFSFVTQP